MKPNQYIVTAWSRKFRVAVSMEVGAATKDEAVTFARQMMVRHTCPPSLAERGWKYTTKKG